MLNAMLSGPGYTRYLLSAFQLQHKARQLCHATHSLLAFPWSVAGDMADNSAELLACTPGYLEYVCVFTVNYQIVLLLPLGITFLIERAHKAAFLHSLGSRKPQWAVQLLDRYRSPSWPDVLLSAWLCLALPWMAVTMVCRLLAAW